LSLPVAMPEFAVRGEQSFGSSVPPLSGLAIRWYPVLLRTAFVVHGRFVLCQVTKLSNGFAPGHSCGDTHARSREGIIFLRNREDPLHVRRHGRTRSGSEARKDRCAESRGAGFRSQAPRTTSHLLLCAVGTVGNNDRSQSGRTGIDSQRYLTIT
jgi:hypothetical protein